MHDDQEIIRQVLNGEVEAFRLLVERYQTPMLRLIVHLIHDRNLSEDIAQEVFLTAFRKLASFDHARSRFSSWLFTIARNKSISTLRRRKPVYTEEMSDGGEGRESQDISWNEFRGALDKALADLPLHLKTAFVMAELNGLSYEEIAEIEAVRLGTVRSRIHRAKRKLQKALKAFA